MTELVESLVDAGEDFVRLVDDAEVERLRSKESIAALLAAGGLAPDEEDAVAVEPTDPRLGFSALDLEELEELLLPLPEERLRRDEQDAPRALRHELRDDEASLDRLPETDLVGEDAPALSHPGEREDDGVDLVRVGVDLRRALRGGIATLFVRPAEAHEVLREIAPLRRVEDPTRPRFTHARCHTRRVIFQSREEGRSSTPRRWTRPVATACSIANSSRVRMLSVLSIPCTGFFSALLGLSHRRKRQAGVPTAFSIGLDHHTFCVREFVESV